MLKIKNIKKSVLLFSVFLNILFFVSPVFAACPPDGVTAAVIGDSLALGIGDDLTKQCPNIHSLGVKSSETPAIKGELTSVVLKGDYKQVTIMGGYNDAHNGSSAQRIEQNLNEMYDAAKGKGISYLALTIPETGNKHPEVVKEVNDWIRSKSGNYVDAASMWATSGNVHNSNSYSTVANAVNSKMPDLSSSAPTTPTAPASTDVKAICKGTETVAEGPPAPQSEEMTLTVQSIDQEKIKDEVGKACEAKCTEKKWTDCNAEITSQQASTGTDQTSPPSGDGTASISPPVAPPSFERTSTLITGSDACEMWKNAFNLGISFIGVAALAGVVWGGFGYITSYGNQEKITSAKETIWGSVTGMFIGLFAYVFFSMINPYLLECKIEAPFKLSASSSSGTTPGTGTQPGGQGPSLPQGVRKEIKECSTQFKQTGKYDQAIQDSASRHQLDPHFLKGIIQTESSYGQNIGPSTTGAYGISQFQPSTFKDRAPSDSPGSCKKKSSTVSATDGYCRNDEENPNPGCCTIAAKRHVCEVYAPDCATWIKANPEKLIEMAGSYLESLRSKHNGNYSEAASAYNGGKWYNNQGPINYANSVASHSEANCKESGGSW